MCIVSTTSTKSCLDGGTLCPGVFTPGLNKLSSCAEVLRLCTVRLGGLLLGASCITLLLTTCDCDLLCCRLRAPGSVLLSSCTPCSTRKRTLIHGSSAELQRQEQTSAFYKIESFFLFWVQTGRNYLKSSQYHITTLLKQLMCTANFLGESIQKRYTAGP